MVSKNILRSSKNQTSQRRTLHKSPSKISFMQSSLLQTCNSEGFNEQELYGAYKIFFGTLVSEPRLKIINLLRSRAMNVSEIVDGIKGEQTAVSHDLARLKNCGFVESEIKGKFRYYKLNKKTIDPLMDLIDKHMCGNCIHILRSKNKFNGGNKNEK